MANFLQRLFGITPVDYKELVKNGATIIDVRTKGEYSYGHIKKSTCIPLDNISAQMNRLKKDQVIITCCQSGSRSGMARRILKNNGFQHVYNGGSWMSLQNKIR